ncbi:MAG: PQQ-dependent sugar dehydrogenase [Pseudolysinimonas sp.]
MPRLPRLASVAALAAVALGLSALAACSAPTAPETFAPSTSGTPSAAAKPTGVVPSGTPVDVVTGLASPWSILRVSSSLTLVSERDSGAIERVTASGALQKVGTVPGVVHDGEGGLLGLAFLEASSGTTTSWLYAYETTASDNRIVRMTLDDQFTLGPPHVILKGLVTANHHDGGRIAFGPDGMLYATVGDAGDTSHSQDLSSLNGKILRMTPTGGVPNGNPFPGSLIWSYGHRNPQGLAWDSSGQLYAAEFGQDTWDEFNKITAGANYGWPIVEGIADDPRFVDPLVQWPTDDASPSGLVYLDGTFFLAGLGGKRLWVINVDAAGAATATALYAGHYGRLRDVAVGPDSGSLPSLWILTDNTDGRGSPKPGDDRILQVALTAVG